MTMPDELTSPFMPAPPQAARTSVVAHARRSGDTARERSWAQFCSVRWGALLEGLPWLKLAVIVAMASIVAIGPVAAQQDVYVAPVAPWPYTDFGRPGDVTSIRTDARLGTTTVAFATGVRLIVKPTRFSPGQVSVIAAFGNGRSGVPDRLVHALWATTLFPIGGTGKLSYAELDRWQRTSGQAVNVTLVPAASAFHLKGEVASSDLLTEMQLLAAYARDPGFREDLPAKIAQVGPIIASQIEGNPASTFMRGVQHTLFGARYQELPEGSDIEATIGNDVPEILGAALATRADVAIVGDISVENAVRATAATFAAGPHMRAARRAKIRTPVLRQGTPPFLFEHQGPADDAWLGEYWPLPDFVTNSRANRIAEVAAAVIEDRLRRVMPTSRNGAAAPAVRSVASLELRGRGKLGIALELHPAEIPAARTRIDGLVGDLAKGRTSADEVERARLAVMTARTSEETSNDWLASRLAIVLRDGRIATPMAEAGDPTIISRDDVAVFLKRYVAGHGRVIVISGSAKDLTTANSIRRYHAKFDTDAL